MRRGIGTLSVAYIVVVGLYACAIYVAAGHSIAGDVGPLASSLIATAREHGWIGKVSDAADKDDPLAGLGAAFAPEDSPLVPSAAEFAEDTAARGKYSPIEIADVYFAPIAAAALRLDVESRLRGRLTSDLFAQFDLFIYVSKAPEGPWAQQMYVFEKDGGKLDLLQNWPVSTGRERMERTPAGHLSNSATPVGYFQFDTARMFRHYRSVTWDEPMPNAMFFNWMDHGLLTGVAIHSAMGNEVSKLGARASAGCIRLSPEASAALFRLVRDEYRGLVPAFAYDTQTATLSRDGELAHTANGSLQYTDGYRVLIVVDASGGGEADPSFDAAPVALVARAAKLVERYRGGIRHVQTPNISVHRDGGAHIAFLAHEAPNAWALRAEYDCDVSGARGRLQRSIRLAGKCDAPKVLLPQHVERSGDIDHANAWDDVEGARGGFGERAAFGWCVTVLDDDCGNPKSRRRAQDRAFVMRICDLVEDRNQTVAAPHSIEGFVEPRVAQRFAKEGDPLMDGARRQEFRNCLRIGGLWGKA